MIAYRIQSTDGPNWTTEWHAQQIPAVKRARKIHEDTGNEVRVDRIELGAGREALCEALNHAQDNFSTWPGVLVRRFDAKNYDTCTLCWGERVLDSTGGWCHLCNGTGTLKHINAGDETDG